MAYMAITTKLTIKQQRFLELYLGDDPALAGIIVMLVIVLADGG